MITEWVPGVLVAFGATGALYGLGVLVIWWADWRRRAR